MGKHRESVHPIEDDDEPGAIKLLSMRSFPLRLLEYIGYQRWARSFSVIVFYMFFLWQLLSACLFTVAPFYISFDFGLYFIVSSVLDVMFGIISVFIFVSSFYYYLWNYEIRQANIDMIEMFFIMVVAAVVPCFTSIIYASFEGINVYSDGNPDTYFKLLVVGLSVANLKAICAYKIYAMVLSDIIEYPELIIIMPRDGDSEKYE